MRARRLLPLPLVLLATLALGVAPAAAVDPAVEVAGAGAKWFSGDLLQQTGQNCSILGSPYTEVMVSGIASYGGAASGGVPKVGERYWTSFLVSIPGNPCGPGSSSVATELVLPPHTQVDTSAPIRCFGQPRNSSTFVELTGGSWSAFGSSGPYCPTQPYAGIQPGSLSFGFRPLASGQLFQIFVPVKSTSTLVGIGTSPPDGFRWLTQATGVYANPGLSTVWANVFAAGASSAPFVYFARPPAVPFWKADAPATPQDLRNRVEFFMNLYTAGKPGDLCYEVRQVTSGAYVWDCAASGATFNRTVSAGLQLVELQATGDARGPNGGYVPFALDPATEWGRDMRITWTFTYDGTQKAQRSATFRALPGPDSDSDGVADAADACPSVKGTQGNGCLPGVQPDSDRDGVFGSADLCPTAGGKGSLDGCPTLSGAAAVKSGATLKRRSLVTGKRITATCSRDAAATLRLTVTKRTAKKLKLRARGSAVTIATAKGSCAAASGASLKLKLAKSALRAVKRAKRPFAATLTLALQVAGSAPATIATPVKVR